MLSQNIRTLRRARGLSQQELAAQLNVVRQTVSKWEQGLSVPDADLLASLSEALETPVGTLLGESVAEREADELKAICAKLEVINVQLARREASRRKAAIVALAIVCVAVVALFAILAEAGSPYLSWDYSDPETAVLGTAAHSFEWLFVRTAPIVLLSSVAGIVLLVRKRG